MEATHVHQQTNGQTKCGMYIYSGILFSLQKEGHSLLPDMDLEDIMLNEIKHLQKDKYCMNPLA